MTRRALLCSLDPKHERPETRIFDSNPVDDAKAERPRLVTSALTILRAFHIAGRPSSACPFGSFDGWSELVRGALLWLDCADPVDSIEAERATDPKLADLAAVMERWRVAFGGERLTVAQVIKTADEHEAGSFSDFARPDLREALLAVAGRRGMIDSRALGNWLSERAGKIVAGCRFAKHGTRQSAGPNTAPPWTLSVSLLRRKARSVLGVSSGSFGDIARVRIGRRSRRRPEISARTSCATSSDKPGTFRSRQSRAQRSSRAARIGRPPPTKRTTSSRPCADCSVGLSTWRSPRQIRQRT
jgi:hypothetical protein